MIPKKATDLIPEFAKKMGIPEQDAKDMIVGFWRILREKQSNLEHFGYNIRGLGRSRASYKKLKEKYFIFLARKDKYRKDKKNPLYIEAVQQMAELDPILQSFYAEWKKEKQHRKEYFELLKQIEDNGLETKTTGSVGEPGQDS